MKSVTLSQANQPAVAGNATPGCGRVTHNREGQQPISQDEADMADLRDQFAAMLPGENEAALDARTHCYLKVLRTLEPDLQKIDGAQRDSARAFARHVVARVGVANRRWDHLQDRIRDGWSYPAQIARIRLEEYAPMVRPGEDFNGVARELEEARGAVMPWNPPFGGTDRMTPMLDRIGKYREPNESVPQSCEGYCSFRRLFPSEVPDTKANEMYDWVWQNREQLSPDGGSSFCDTSKSVAQLGKRYWIEPGNRPQDMVEMLQAALDKRKPGDSVEQSCARWSNFRQPLREFQVPPAAIDEMYDLAWQHRAEVAETFDEVAQSVVTLAREQWLNHGNPPEGVLDMMRFALQERKPEETFGGACTRFGVYYWATGSESGYYAMGQHLQQACERVGLFGEVPPEFMLDVEQQLVAHRDAGRSPQEAHEAALRTVKLLWRERQVGKGSIERDGGNLRLNGVRIPVKQS